MITADTIALARDGSREFDAYLARPSGKAPTIVIFTEMFGVAATIAQWPMTMPGAASPH